MVKEGLINLDFADVRSIMSEMGKAMMGTGEATGESARRARRRSGDRQSAARRDLDEGARGLLISITGGNDLTLYEVDEAASRIRQEVDEEANIILGATFDFARRRRARLVVATGIDQPAIAQIEPVTSSRGSKRGAPASLRASAPPSRRPRRPSQLRPTPVATATSSRQAPVHRVPGTDQAPGRGATTPAEFIPPAPEQPVTRGARMPEIEDLPQVAQNQFRAMREAQATVPAPETRRRSLLEKLAAFGITRHDEEPAPAPPPRRCPGAGDAASSALRYDARPS